MYVIEDEGSIVSGLFSALGLYMLQGVIIVSFADLIPFKDFSGMVFLALGPPVVQCLYIVPLYLERKSRQRMATAHGLLAGAIFAGLLHFAVFGWLAFPPR